MTGHQRTPKSLAGDIALALFVLFVDVIGCLNVAVWSYGAHASRGQVALGTLLLAGLILASSFAFRFGRSPLLVTAGIQVFAGAVVAFVGVLPFIGGR
ncbi:hypothetical protein ABII15_23215 [Streptomyces sp. HUAS MG91]|uniref:Uncharacterized protein n=1 Tax=Streptomyces tabacisoli TaxID=3156398 RepID=A0AAU8IY16_9ACTN